MPNSEHHRTYFLKRIEQSRQATVDIERRMNKPDGVATIDDHIEAIELLVRTLRVPRAQLDDRLLMIAGEACALYEHVASERDRSRCAA